MSSRAVHEAAATINIELAKRVAEPGWRVTVVYYAAIQKVEAMLADHNRHPQRHRDRHRDALDLAPDVAAPWRKLKQLSEGWRYAGIAPTGEECEYADRWAFDMAAACREDWPD